MEFSKKTPKSHTDNVIRSNPYATGGKNYLTKFQSANRSSSLYATPPRTKPYASLKRFSNKTTRARNIFKNSPYEKTKGLEYKYSPKLNGHGIHLNQKKRPFNSSKEDVSILYSDDTADEFLSSKYSKKEESLYDKENNISPSASTSKLQSLKNKNPPLSVRSRILHDISPEKLNSLSEPDSTFSHKERKTYKFKSFSGKENTFVEKNQPSTIHTENLPHMVGFPNFGNTCYLNAVLQTLFGLPSFVSDLSNAVETLNVSSSSLCQSVWNVVVAREKYDSLRLRIALRTLKENIEKVDGSFSGYKMQDANEFLTQVLDTIKDEVASESLKCAKEKNFNCSTCTPEKLPALIDPKIDTSDDLPELKSYKRSIFSTPSCSPSSPESQGLKSSAENSRDIIFPLSQTVTPEKLVLTLTDNNRNEIQRREDCIVNPVTNNFEFELSESFRCLGCGEAEGRRQKHFALYVDLPVEDGRSIQEAVESYMGEDHRDLKCEKCSHGKALFLTSFTELPRVLIVQMKRYTYNAENLELVKVSSKVEINLWLHLDKVTTAAVTPPPYFDSKPIRYQRKDSKLSTLSVRNLSSELNVCAESIKEDTKPNENQELQEVLQKSVEEMGEVPRVSEKSDEEKEDEELQTAIRLSLQELGMSYANQDAEGDGVIQKINYENELKSKHSYRLVSVVSHFGVTTTTGHYVSDVFKCDEDKWYHYDDENVNSLSDSIIGGEGRQKNGYIFFYIHRDIYNDMKKLKY